MVTRAPAPAVDRGDPRRRGKGPRPGAPGSRGPGGRGPGGGPGGGSGRGPGGGPGGRPGGGPGVRPGFGARAPEARGGDAGAKRAVFGPRPTGEGAQPPSAAAPRWRRRSRPRPWWSARSRGGPRSRWGRRSRSSRQRARWWARPRWWRWSRTGWRRRPGSCGRSQARFKGLADSLDDPAGLRVRYGLQPDRDDLVRPVIAVPFLRRRAAVGCVVVVRRLLPAVLAGAGAG